MKAKKAKRRAKIDEKIDGLSTCVAIHAALRKACDSRPTSKLYNVVDVICQIGLPEHLCPWRLFGKLVADGINDDELPWQAIHHAIVNFEAAWQEDCLMAHHDNGFPEGFQTTQRLLRWALEECSPSDIESMASFLPDEQE